MIVIAETNFVLEVAFSRDKFESCHELIALAAGKEIELFLPAYSFVEPYETLIRRRKTRKQAHATISVEVQEIARSAHFEDQAKQLADLTGLLIDVGELEQRELDDTVSELLSVASIIELSAGVLAQSVAYRAIGLAPQDSVVFASVISALTTGQHGPACFITKNKKDFAAPDITQALDQLGCKLMFDFERALEFVRHGILAANPPEPSPAPGP